MEKEKKALDLLTDNSTLPNLPPSDIMKLKSSAKLRSDDCVIGDKGSSIFCCISSAYIQRVIHRSKCPISA